MQTKRTYSLFETLRWSKNFIFGPALYAAVVVCCYKYLWFTWFSIPWLPISVIGVAVAFFVGFKNSSSYARLWEARQIYGAIVNNSRIWGISVIDFVTNLHAPNPAQASVLQDFHKELIYRHIAWLTALRHQLRKPRPWEHQDGEHRIDVVRSMIREYNISMEKEMEHVLSATEISEMIAKKNTATQLLARQSARLRELREQGFIDDFRHVELQRVIASFYEEQGKCERIKNFPFPRQYATINTISVWIFALLLPLGMIDAFEQMSSSFIWWVIPFSTLVSWLYFTIELIGDYSENPFEGAWNDIPITALSRTIEIDLREMLGESPLPPPIEPVHDLLF